MAKLDRAFYARPTLDVARELLGKVLVHNTGDRGRLAGRIVETEAYVGPTDQASHASRGLTPRASIMFGPPGRAYIYLIYGMYWCLNIVTESEGFPAAVLVRAVEPVEGIATPTDGPGKLCRAMLIDGGLNGTDITGDTLYMEDDGAPPPEVETGPRVGVDYAGEWAAKQWRFYVKGSRYVSRAGKGAAGRNRAEMLLSSENDTLRVQ